MRRIFWIALMLMVVSTPALADEEQPVVAVSIPPLHDTWATHDDGLVHGTEDIIKVGVEPQQCVPGGWDKCDDDGMVCCEKEDDYNYCAPPGECDTTTPSWKSYRKFRGYLRFPLYMVPEGEIQSATLRMTPVTIVNTMGGDPTMEVYRLKSIGDGICEWDENTLNDTNLTTWSSLPQNVSITNEGVWVFDVTKAVKDWLDGNSDLPGNPIAPNCGFHLADPDFGNQQEPLMRWVEFSSKEGIAPPQLTITVAKDLDEDGYYGDCDETNPDINPGATEVCDEIDNDCDGKVDEEDCDGLDNDCDGEIDEGEDLCGAGMMCIYHQCIETCQDECAGPYDLTCNWDEDGGVWQVLACDDTDDDPCLEYYVAETCDEGDYCGFGWCAGNCVDECDEDGLKECWKNDLQQWFVAQCGDWDGDGCLEPGNMVACGPSATCEDAVCQGGCEDECDELGKVGCQNATTVWACYDGDDDGCMEWTVVGTCDEEGFVCYEGECINGDCQDDCQEGLKMCGETPEDNGIVYECATDGDEDACTEWKVIEECENGCDDEALACAADEPQPDTNPEPAPDVVTGEDAVTAVDTAQPGQDTEQPGVDTAQPGTDTTQPAADVGGGDDGGDDGGCAVATTGSPLFLLLLLLLAPLRRRQ